MKITFLGAAHQVTGSCTMIEWKPGKYFLVDYGMEQGDNDLEQSPLPVAPSMIDYVFLTHAHIDHSGMIPLLVKNGFRGIIYSTSETISLCHIMLSDSAHIQETDAAYETKKNQRIGGNPVEPLYTLQDVENAMKLFQPCEYGKITMVDEGLTVWFNDAGHLLGSSFIEFFIEDNGVSRKLVCSGDVGNTNQPIIRDPQPVSDADYLLIESTYGTRSHEKAKEPLPILADVLRETFRRGGTVIIPSFAVGRTQELLYFFREIKQDHLLPEFEDFPVYVDSPMANEATAVFLQCSMECLDEDTLKVMSSGENPIWFEGLNTIVTADESKALNTDDHPKVIIASGGMCDGGRIRHHLKHRLWDAKNTVLFVGYQAAGTLGRIIYDGAKHVKILGEEIDVNADIRLLSGVSGHADQEGLISWVSGIKNKPLHVFVNHGDDESCTGFAETVKNEFSLNADAPYSGSVFDMRSDEWIRITDPILKKRPVSTGKKSAAKANKAAPYTELQNAVDLLYEYTKKLSSHSNGELRKLTEKILALIKDQD